MVQLVDAEVTVSFAVDPTLATLEDIRRFAAEAISAKLEELYERVQHGELEEAKQPFFYNGDGAADARFV